MSYNSLYDMFKLGISSVISWMESLEYEGINLLHIAFVALFFSLIWQFVLAPVIGNRPGGISIGASDMVSYSRNVNRQKEASSRREISSTSRSHNSSVRWKNGKNRKWVRK